MIFTCLNCKARLSKRRLLTGRKIRLQKLSGALNVVMLNSESLLLTSPTLQADISCCSNLHFPSCNLQYCVYRYSVVRCSVLVTLKSCNCDKVWKLLFVCEDFLAERYAQVSPHKPVCLPQSDPNFQVHRQKYVHYSVSLNGSTLVFSQSFWLARR